MSNLTDQYSVEEIEEAASSLFEIGLGHHRADDNHMAKILLGVAKKMWEDIGDNPNAKKARTALRSISSSHEYPNRGQGS